MYVTEREKEKKKRAEFKAKMLTKTPKFTALFPGILICEALNYCLDLWPPQCCVPRDGKCSTLVAGLVFPGYVLCKSQTEAVWKITWMPWSKKLKEKIIFFIYLFKADFPARAAPQFYEWLVLGVNRKSLLQSNDVCESIIFSHKQRKNLNNSLCFGLFWLNVALEIVFFRTVLDKHPCEFFHCDKFKNNTRCHV